MNILGVCAAQGALLHCMKSNVICNIEPRAVFHTKKEEQWRSNFGNTPFIRDFPENLPEVDVIVGSPSCGHSSIFSYSRKKTLGEPKSDPTLNLYLESIDKYKPKVFLMENLPKLMDLIPLPEWKAKFPDYRLIVHCYSVMSFGNSQKSRIRLVLIGVRRDSGIGTRNFKRVYSVSNPMRVSEILELVRKPLNFKESKDKKLSMYHQDDSTRETLTVKEVRKLWKTEFKDLYKWPVKTQKMKTLPGVYRNRMDAYPLTARPSSRQFNPKGNIMGLEEYRIIMGFPEDFIVYFDKGDPTYWLNKGRNTLTKGSVYEIGVWFKDCLTQAGIM